MATLQQLHRLVHSLNKNEKKNLSLLISALSGKARQRYSESLQIIKAQKTYDASTLKEKLKQHVNGMNLSEANTNLYQFICQSLIVYNRSAAGNLGLLKDITLLETLIMKGHYDAAQSILPSILSRAKKGNSHGMLHRAQELQSLLFINNQADLLNYDKRLQFIEQRLADAHDYVRHMEVTLLNTSFYKVVKQQGEPRSAKDLSSYEQLRNFPAWHMPLDKVPQQSFHMLAPLRLAIMIVLDGEKAALTGCKQALEFHRSRNKLADHVSTEFALLDVFTICAIYLDDVKEMRAAVKQLQALMPHITQITMRQRVVMKMVMAELSAFLHEKQYEKGIQRYHYWNTASQKQQWNNSPLAFYAYMLGARLYYMQGDANKALDQLLQIGDAEKHMRPHTIIAMRFLSLLCHYRMGDYQYLRHAAKAMQRLLQRMDKLYAPEKAMLRFVKRCEHPDQLRAELQKLSDAFALLEQDRFHKPFFEFGDYREWLRKELNGRRKL